jgi:hypothetical protein
MSTFALVCNYEGDYGMKVLTVDTEDTMEDVARIAKNSIAGVFVAEPPVGSKLRVRRHGSNDDLPDTLKVGDADFIVGETIDIIVTSA